MEKSFFRLKIFGYKLVFTIPYFFLLSLFLGVATALGKGSMFFYLFYPLVYLGLEVGISGQSLINIWYLNILLFYPTLFVLLEKKKWLKAKQYLDCPYCKQAVSVFYSWGCDKCNNYQAQNQYITASCSYCDKHLKSFFCEHCHKEFKL